MEFRESAYFHSNGKVLLTGEYLVLYGAKALAMPVATGQSLIHEHRNTGYYLQWTTLYRNAPVLELNFDENLNVQSCYPSDFDTSFLINLLQAAKKLNPLAWKQLQESSLLANIEFSHNWGLGSSSSLISNIAWLFDINPYTLHFLVSKGSGYDIACARSKQAILYQLTDNRPIVHEVSYQPAFRDELYFIYLGKKQDSAAEVSRFLKSKTVASQDILTVGELTDAFLQAANGTGLSKVIREHEKLLSSYLGIKPIKEQYFSNFEGEIKSLGAWGGDLALVYWTQGEERLRNYFSNKNLYELTPFNELISC